jgi:ABC-type branched-subunit amino acid transport system ATPase component
VLSLKAIETYYGTSQVLFGLSLDVQQGEVVTLLGRNGMGKTTTVRSIMGLTPIRAGVITLDGQAIHTLPPYRIARRGLGLVPEGRQIFSTLSVREHLVATAARHWCSSAPWTLERVYDLFPTLAPRQHHMGAQLSGGEQQMLAIGRALMTNPRLMKAPRSKLRGIKTQNLQSSKQLHLDVLTMQLLIGLCAALLLDILAYDFFIAMAPYGTDKVSFGPDFPAP